MLSLLASFEPNLLTLADALDNFTAVQSFDRLAHKVAEIDIRTRFCLLKGSLACGDNDTDQKAHGCYKASNHDVAC